MNLFMLCIVLSAFVAVVHSYTFTSIKDNIGNTVNSIPLFIDSNQTYAYTASQQGAIYKIDLSTSATTTILSNGAPDNCYAVALYVDPVTLNPAILYGGQRQFYSYDSLTTGGTKTVPYTVSGNGANGGYNANGLNIIGFNSAWFRANCIVTDSPNSVMYISDTDNSGPSSTQGAIWKLNFASGSAFTASSLTKLALKAANGATYTPGDPYGMSLVGTTSTLYFVERKGDKVCKVDVTTLVVTQIITTGIAYPMGIAVDSAEAYAYVSTWWTPINSIIRVDLAANSFTTLVSAPGGVTAMIFNSAGTDIIMTCENDLVQMDLVAPSPPTQSPTAAPTTAPSRQPTQSPTTAPSRQPTTAPTTSPTTAPTTSPTTALSQ